MGSVYEVVVHHMNCVVSVSILPIDILHVCTHPGCMCDKVIVCLVFLPPQALLLQGELIRIPLLLTVVQQEITCPPHRWKPL